MLRRFVFKQALGMMQAIDINLIYGEDVKQFLKVLLIAWIAVMAAILCSKYLMPSSASTMEEFHELSAEIAKQSKLTEEQISQLDAAATEEEFNELRAEIAKQGEPTEAQKKRRDELFLALNVAGNIQNDALGYIAKNVAFFLIMMPLSLWLARISDLSQNTVLLSAALIFLPFIFVQFYTTGALLASAYVLGGIAFKKRKPESTDAKPAES